MKYGDLVAFDPVDTVKVLREADDRAHAEEDVRTFVFSDRMIEQIRDIIVPNLGIDQAQDQKGLLIVANYGTGKTHLMSVLSTVAESTDMADLLTRPEARDALAPISGRFKVVRAEIGATEMSLRDIILTFLKDGLARVGVRVEIKSLKEVPHSMDLIAEVMAAFEEKHPGFGLLIVLDELLDYLRGRKDHELTQDLAFLREVGHVLGSTKFRFIAGLQEALFDNPRFANVSDTVRRVKARYEQVRISREDIAFVVEERLLKKSTEQRDRIRQHLQPFTPLYEGMAENLDEFVSLFPVHPAYLRTFERITLVEKREVLKTLSREMSALLPREVPESEPGLVCHDSYRARITEDPSNRAIPEVREVLDKGEVLRSRAERSILTRQYLPTALRIIDGLIVHRLTTEDINAPIGPTRKELRDDLCLLPPNLPENDPFFLETTVDSIIAEIMKAVSGQFISENPANGQLFLDVKKDIDYDQQIEERASHLDNFRLDEAYFKALEEVLEVRESPYVSGYRIWAYELPWADHGAMRSGYLFMGAPNERSTAQPPRDFYVYFLQPYDRPKFKDERKPDEVFVRLDKPEKEFTEALRRYAGASALAVESTPTHRAVYEDKAKGTLRRMVTWLRANMHEAFTVIHEGDSRSMGAWLAKAQGPRSSIKEQIDTIAAIALAPHFASRYPDYPNFGTSVPVGKDNVESTVRQVLQQIVTGRPTALGTTILESLELLDVHGQMTDAGRFAGALLASLDAAGGKVLNRTELLVERDPGVWAWPPWYLEPAWVMVIAAALVQQGRLEIHISGSRVDALGLERIQKMGLEEFERFSHFAPPKTVPILQLREVARLVGLPPAGIPDQGVDAALVKQLLARTEDLLVKIVEARGRLADGLVLWGAHVIDQVEGRDKRLEALQKILENVKARNTVGKMNHLDLDPDLLSGAKKGRAELDWIEAALAARGHLSGSVEYLVAAVEVFGRDHDVSKQALALREEILALYRRDAPVSGPRVSELRNAAEELRHGFAEEAARAHSRDRLDAAGDEKKRQILEGPTFRSLDVLASVNLLPDGAFGSLRDRLVAVGTCKMFDESRLLENVVCTQCGYEPRPSKGPTARAAVESVADDLERLRKEWEQTLLDNLRQPEMQQQIPLLDADEREEVEAILAKGRLPEAVTDVLAKGLNRVFERFVVKKIGPGDVWAALFPEQAPTTPGELRGRFSNFLQKQIGKTPDDKIRIVPASEEERP